MFSWYQCRSSKFQLCSKNQPKLRKDEITNNSNSLLMNKYFHTILIRDFYHFNLCKFRSSSARDSGSCARAWPYIKLYSENALFYLKSSSLLPGINQTIYLYSYDDLGKVHQSCNFYDPRGRSWPYVIQWKCIISLNILSTPRHTSDKLSIK